MASRARDVLLSGYRIMPSEKHNLPDVRIGKKKTQLRVASEQTTVCPVLLGNRCYRVMYSQRRLYRTAWASLPLRVERFIVRETPSPTFLIRIAEFVSR